MWRTISITPRSPRLWRYEAIAAEGARSVNAAVNSAARAAATAVGNCGGTCGVVR